MRLPKLERWDSVEIVWHDAHGGGSDTWETLGAEHLKLEQVVTTGQFFDKTDEAICVVLSHTGRNHVDAYITVPLVNVEAIRRLG